MSYRTEACAPAKEVTELRPCSATEALRREVTTLDVGDDEELVLSSGKRAHQKYFARVAVERFDDLQVLGLVPRRIKQQAVRTAIRADDEQALRIAEERARSNGRVAPSTCNCHESSTVPSFSEDLRSTYRQVRRDYNPALARVLSDHFGTEFAFDSTLAISVRGWTERITAGALTTIALFEDITIGRQGRLVLDPASTVLYAGAILIHRTGTLIHRGGYLKIWANSIESFLDLPVKTTAQTKIWALDK